MKVYFKRILQVGIPAGALLLAACPAFGPGCPIERTESFALAGDGGSAGDGGAPHSDCKVDCADNVGKVNLLDCQYAPTDGGQPGVTCHFTSPCTGRRPAAMEALAPPATANPAGAYLAESAALEAASVPAFRHLQEDLVEHGAPPSLVRAAERAARDEIRHTRVIGALARRHGVAFAPPVVGARVSRPLGELAIENVVEGCVRETFGALIAHLQALRATDPAVRSAMARIARDETEHAELAFAVAAWAEPLLDADGRARVAEARAHAARALLEEVSRPRPDELGTLLGIPGPEESAALVAQLDRDLWSKAA